MNREPGNRKLADSEIEVVGLDPNDRRGDDAGRESGGRPGEKKSAPDYFVERDGVRFAGTHLLIDMWGARHLDDEEIIRDALIRSLRACRATLLHIHLHNFGESGGISGVAVLAESHISIHTWPEREFGAIDIFMCGACDPFAALPVLKEVFRPREFNVLEQRRGLTE